MRRQRRLCRLYARQAYQTKKDSLSQPATAARNLPYEPGATSQNQERIPRLFRQRFHDVSTANLINGSNHPMPFDKFVDMHSVSEERRKAIQESLKTMSVADLRQIVKELSDFEGDPWRENFVSVIEAHPEASFYRAVTQGGAVVLYCPGEDTGVWFLPGRGMGPLPEEAKRHMKEAMAAPGRKRTGH